MKHSFIYRLIRAFLWSSILVMTVITVAIVLLRQNAMTEKMDYYNSKSEQNYGFKEGRADDVALNLVYVIGKEEDLKELYIEVFHCKNRELSYISIPLDTTFTLSAKLYQKLIGINPKISQRITLKHVLTYFEENSFDYGTMIIDELLEIDSSYYTAITLEDQSFMDYFEQLLDKITTKKEIKRYINELYPKLETNLSKKDKLIYLDYYVEIKEEVQFYEAKGTNKNEHFELDRIENKVFINSLAE